VTPEQQSAIRGACRSDFMSKCSGVTPGGKEALQCLQTNVTGLSPACKTAVSATISPPAAPARPAQAQTPPPAPAAAPAAPPPAPTTGAPSSPPPSPAVRQVAPKPAQLAKPQSQQQGQQPGAPKQAAVPPPAAPVATPAPPTAEQLKALNFTCRRDLSRFCASAPPGSPQALSCLQGNAAKLTPDCRTSVADIGDAVSPPSTAPASSGTPNAPIVMTAVIGRACMRDLLMHCRDIKVGDGRKIDCLMARGDKLALMCKAALKITDPVR
jgi:hypothetical protein